MESSLRLHSRILDNERVTGAKLGPPDMRKPSTHDNNRKKYTLYNNATRLFVTFQKICPLCQHSGRGIVFLAYCAYPNKFIGPEDMYYSI